MRNISYDDLENVAGIRRDQITRVEYKSKGRADSGIASEEAKEVTGEVADVRMKKGKTKAGKEYVLYTIFSGGDQYKTFSESHAKLAKEAMETGTPVNIRYTSDNYGHTVESIVTAEREPGEEG